MTCEDYPCCGHERGSCPDEEGRMPCVYCFAPLPRNARSSICLDCQSTPSIMCGGRECEGCSYCLSEDGADEEYDEEQDDVDPMYEALHADD